MEDHRKLKDEIINFVQSSPEEVNAQVAVFIAGMQAQKSLIDCRQKTDRDKFCVVKPASVEKQGG